MRTSQVRTRCCAQGFWVHEAARQFWAHAILLWIASSFVEQILVVQRAARGGASSRDAIAEEEDVKDERKRER